MTQRERFVRDKTYDAKLSKMTIDDIWTLAQLAAKYGLTLK